MMDERTLLVGLDLGYEVSGLTCYDESKAEPISIGRKYGEKREYEFPTEMAVSRKTGEWFFGKDAADTQEGGIIVFPDFLRKITQGQEITTSDYDTSAVYIVERYLVKILSLLKEYYPDKLIKKLVVTVPEKTETLLLTLKEAFKRMGIGADRLTIQNHQQSYMYYAMSQKNELCMNNIGLFDYSGDGLFYAQITIDRRTEPYIVGVTKKDLSKVISYDLLEDEDQSQLPYAFYNVADMVLHKQLVTTIYVTGKGFEGDWAEDTLKKLCNGRRVFLGQNLYTKGACYAARELSGKRRLEHCLLLDEDMIFCNISILVYKDAAMQEILLAKAGTPWREVDSCIDVIPDEEEEIQITIQNVLEHEKKAHLLSLNGFEDRGNKMTRFTVRMRFHSTTECVITLKDNGFGEFSPTSNRIWEKVIRI